MKLTVKDMSIATGGILVAILSKYDAVQLDVTSGDRISIKAKGREITAIVDIATSRTVGKGEIGMFEELLRSLNVYSSDQVDISLEKPPKSISSIRKKLYGNEWNKDDITHIVNDIVKNNLTDTEIAFFVSAAFCIGLSLKEIVTDKQDAVDFR